MKVLSVNLPLNLLTTVACILKSNFVSKASGALLEYCCCLLLVLELEARGFPLFLNHHLHVPFTVHLNPFQQKLKKMYIAQPYFSEAACIFNYNSLCQQNS